MLIAQKSKGNIGEGKVDYEQRMLFIEITSLEIYMRKIIFKMCKGIHHQYMGKNELASTRALIK